MPTPADPHLILWPVAALAALTFVVLMLLPISRVGAALRGKVSPRDFRYGESDRVPDQARLVNRNYMNLLELPVLFYVVALIAFVDHRVTPVTLGLAWTFVSFRLAHTLLHLTVNNVLVRLILFAGSALSLLALWVAVFLPMMG